MTSPLKPGDTYIEGLPNGARIQHIVQGPAPPLRGHLPKLSCIPVPDARIDPDFLRTLDPFCGAVPESTSRAVHHPPFPGLDNLDRNTHISLSSDSQFAVVHHADAVAVLSRHRGELFRIPHVAWYDDLRGQGCFIGEHLWTPLPVDDGATYELVIVSLPTGEVLARAPLPESVDAAIHARPHPAGEGVELDAAHGQDGTVLYTARLLDDGLTVVTRPQWSQLPTSFSPSGAEILTVPHPGFLTSGLVVYRWPDLQELARLDPDDCFEQTAEDQWWARDTFTEHAWHRTDHQLVALSRRGKLMLIDRTHMRPIAELLLNGESLDRTESKTDRPDVFPLDTDHFLIHRWPDTITLWALPLPTGY